MDAYEEDSNPFEADDHVASETSSTSIVDVSEPNSPPNLARPLSQSAPVAEKTVPLPSLQKPLSATVKADFCCSRDRWLHSEQEVEITVSGSYIFTAQQS